MIPFLLLEETLAANPVKLYEYSAMEVPVVSTDLPECRAYDVVRIAHTSEEFIHSIEDAAAQRHSPELKRKLRELALANTWDQRVNTVLERLGMADRYPRKSPDERNHN
jgi:hypothetical protein